MQFLFEAAWRSSHTPPGQDAPPVLHHPYAHKARPKPVGRAEEVDFLQNCGIHTEASQHSFNSSCVLPFYFHLGLLHHELLE